MNIGKLLKPTNDYVFQRIFGYIGNEEITKGLISAIVDNINITEIKLDVKKDLERDLKDDKLGILDVRAVIDGEIQCNIEMQMIDRRDIENRILYYWSKLYTKSINIGEDYINAKRTIIILFTDYEIKGHEEIEKYLSKWHIREDEYSNIILTKNLEMCIIELPKYKKYASKNRELSTWVKFITSPGEISMEDMKDNEPLKKANKVLEEISDDEHEQELAFQRLMYEMDKKAIRAAGYDKGVEDGIIEVAKKMLQQGISIETIVECTGLKKEEIEKLK